MRSECVRAWNHLAGDERGTVTVETAIWLPFFFFLLMLVTNVSLAFHGKAQAFRVMQDANRALSIGRLADAAAAESFIERSFGSLSSGANATVRVDDGIVSTMLTIPVSDLILFDGMMPFSDTVIKVGAQHLLES